jgi:hypothetical protein
MPRTHPAIPAGLAGLAVAALIAACASPQIDRVPAVLIPGPITGEIGPAPGVPAECLAAFPLAVGPARLDDLSLLPEDWPAPPERSTLCLTSARADRSIETADYATSLDPIEIVSYYAARMPAGTNWQRAEVGSGLVLTGTAGQLFFEIRPGAGAFTILFVDDAS